MEKDQLIDNIILELRRGVIVLAVLNLLQQEQYGYSILKMLAEQGLEVDQGTLYRCCAGWNPRGCWNPNGGSKKLVRGGITSSVLKGVAFYPGSKKNGRRSA